MDNTCFSQLSVDEGYNKLEIAYQNFLHGLSKNHAFHNETKGAGLVHDQYVFKSDESKVHLLLIWLVKKGFMPYDYLIKEEKYLHDLITQRKGVETMFDTFEGYIQKYFRMQEFGDRPKHLSPHLFQKRPSSWFFTVE